MCFWSTLIAQKSCLENKLAQRVGSRYRELGTWNVKRDMSDPIVVDNLRVTFPGRGGTGPVETVGGLSLTVARGN